MMLAEEMPSPAASSRDDQCVTPSRSGGFSSIVTTIAVSSTVFGWPARARSPSARMPPDWHRARHSRTCARKKETFLSQH